MGIFQVPDGPYGIAFDGTYMWLSGDLYIRVLRAGDGFPVWYQQVQTTGVAFDGAYVWIAQTNANAVLKF
jgi:hypothetical protein